MPDPPALAPLMGAVATASIESCRSSSSSSSPLNGVEVVSLAGGRQYRRVTEAEMESTWRKFLGTLLCRDEFAKALLEVEDMVRELTVIIGPSIIVGLLQDRV